MGKNDTTKKSSKWPKILIVVAVICVIGMFGKGKNKGNDAKKTEEPTTAVATTQKSTEAATEAAEASTESGEPSLYQQLSELKGKTVKEGMKALNDTGYTIQYLNQGEDFTEFIDSFNDNIIKDIEVDNEAKKIVVNILPKDLYEANDVEAKLEQKLPQATAWSAVKKYGEEQYGKFKLHNLTGVIYAGAEDENTWFLKCECTADGEDKVCEAKVTGTEASPEVTSFDVY